MAARALRVSPCAVFARAAQGAMHARTVRPSADIEKGAAFGAAPLVFPTHRDVGSVRECREHPRTASHPAHCARGGRLAQGLSKPFPKMRSLQVTTTVVTFAAATVPLPPVTVQTSIGLVGWVDTVTA